MSHNKIGDVLVAQGDGPGALAAYRKALAIAEAGTKRPQGARIAEALAARDPANAQWQRDVAVRVGLLEEAMGIVTRRCSNLVSRA